MRRLFPQLRIVSASFGVFLVLHRDFALALECLGCACGVAISLCMPLLRFDRRLRLLALWVFAADLLTCVSVLSGAAELCLLSLLLLGAG